MTTVRRMTKTTVTLIILTVGLYLLMHWSETLSGKVFQMKLLLNSKAQIGEFHCLLLRLSFWLLLIAAGIETIYCEKNGVHVFGSFGVPFIFSLWVAVWGLVAISTLANILWFWLFYYVSLFICIRISYRRLSNIIGTEPSKTKLPLQKPSSKDDDDISRIDRSILCIAKIVMLVDWFALLTSAIVFCVQHKQIFGL